MKYKCTNCGTLNNVPEGKKPSGFSCYECGSQLSLSSTTGDASAAVGLIGGAALGASIAGPIGAIVGGVLGAVIGKESKGVG